MPRTYRISLGTFAYPVAVSILWFAGWVWGTFSWAGPLADGVTPAAVSLTVFCLLLALLPALRTASMTYRVVLTERQCNFRNMWVERHVLVQEITAIDWDEGDIYIRHNGGLVHIHANQAFHDLLTRLLELNPAIITHDEVRQRLNPVADPPSFSLPAGARSASRRPLTDRSEPSTKFHESFLFPLFVGCLLVYLMSH